MQTPVLTAFAEGNFQALEVLARCRGLGQAKFEPSLSNGLVNPSRKRVSLWCNHVMRLFLGNKLYVHLCFIDYEFEE